MEIEFHIEAGKVSATINQIQVQQQGKVLSFSASGTLSLADYFSQKGNGHDCSVSVQTVEGRIDIPIVENIIQITDETVSVSVPTEGQSLLNTIKKGDRFIFAIHRPKKD